MSNERTLMEKCQSPFFVCRITLSDAFAYLLSKLQSYIVYSKLRQEVRQMKRKDYHIYLDEQEYSQVIQSLVTLKNNLIAQGRYTDAVDDVLIKFTKARKKKITV